MLLLVLATVIIPYTVLRAHAASLRTARACRARTLTRVSAGTPHGLIDLMTTDNTREDENSIATFGTRNNARARHVQEVAVPFRSRRGYIVIGAYTRISACFLTT